MIDGMNASISLGIDIEKSVEATKESIAELQRRLDAAGVKIKLKAELDKNIQQSIKNLGTTGVKVATDSGKKIGEALGNSLINQYNIKNKQAQNQIKNLTNMLQNVSIGEIKTDSYNPKYLDYINQLGEVIIKNAQIMQERTGIYDKFFKYFQGVDKIKIPQIVQNTEDWNTDRMVAAGKFITDPSKKGIELDSAYKMMAADFKDMFSGTADPTEQFKEIVNAIKLYKSDVDKMEPVNLKDKIGYEDDMYSQLYADLTVMRTQLKAQLESINGDVSAEAQNIKKSLLDIDVSFDKGTISELTSQVKGYFTQLEGITDKDIKLQFLKGENEDVTAFNATLDKGRGIIEKYSFAMNEMGQYVYSGGNIIDKSGKEFAEVSAKAAEFQSKLEGLKSTYKSFLSGDSTNNSLKSLVDSIDFSNISDKGSLDAMIAKYDQATEKAKSFNAEITKKWSSNAAEKLDQYIKELPSDLDYLESKFKGANFDMSDDVAQAFKTMRQQLQQIGNIDEPEGKIKLYNQLTESLNTCTQRFKQMSIEQKNAAKDTKLNADKSLFGTNLDTWMNKNTDAAIIFSSRLAQIKADLQSADSVKFTALQNEFRQIQSEAKQMGLTTNATVQEMKSAFDSTVANVVSLTAAFQTFKQMVNTAKDIDTSLYNLQVATGGTREQTKALIGTYNEMAQDLGSTTTQVANAADDWLRSGKSISEANDLIKDSMVLAKIGMMETGEATEDLMAILNGYHIDASKAIEIISKLGSVDRESASDAGGLAEALSRTASSAKQAGVDIDLLLGMLAAMKDTAPTISNEQIGNSIKSITARFSQVKANKFVDAETGDDLSNVETVLGKIGIKIRSSIDDYRDLSDVLRELAAKYNDLTDVQRNAVGSALFGTYQSNLGTLMLSNWNKVEKLTKVSENSSDEALKKFNDYADTVEAHINSMKAAYEKLSMQLADSEFLKGAADGGAAFLNVLSEVIDKLGVLSTAMGAITAGGALRGKTIGVFNNNGSEITFLGKTLEEMRQASAEGEKFGGLFTKNVVQPIANADSIISNYNVLVKAQCANQKAINQLTNDFDMRSYLSGLNGAEATMKGYTASLNASKTATMALKLETVALNMALNMGITAAITAGIWAIGKAYDYVAHNVDNLKEKAEESAQAYEDAKNEVESLNDELKTTNSRIDELEAKDHLSFIEQEELQKLKDANAELERSIQLAEIKADTAGKQSRADALKALGAESYYGSYEGIDLDKSSIYEGYQNIGTMIGGRGTVMENAIKQLADYNRYLEERKKIEQQIADIEQKNPTGYQDQADYAMLTNAKKQYDSWILESENALSEMSGNLTNFKKSLDPSQDAELISSINSFLDGYMQDYENTAENITEAFNNVWNDSGFAKYKAALESLAKEGKLDADVLSSNEQYKKLLDATGKSAEEVCNQIYSLTKAEVTQADAADTSKSGMIEQLNSLSEGFEELDKIIVNIIDKDKAFDFSLLDDKKFKDTFGSLGQEYEDFVEQISNTPKDVNACQDAFNGLISKWIETTGVLDSVNEGNAALTTAMLSNMGVTNADAVVQQALAHNLRDVQAEEEYAAITSKNLADATTEEVLALNNESSVLDSTKQNIAQYKLAKETANGITLDTSADIANLMSLVKMCGGTVTALQAVYNAKQGAFQALQTNLQQNLSLPVLSADPIAADMALKQAKQDTENLKAESIQMMAAATKEINDVLNGNYKVDANYGGGNKTANKNSSGSDKKSGSKSTKEFDWQERKLKLLEEELAKAKENTTSDTLAYTGIDSETVNRALELFDKIHNQVVVSTDDFSWLIQAASAAGMSLDEFYNHLQNGGAVTRASAFEDTIARQKELLAGYQEAADSYSKQYEEAVSKLSDGYRDKIEHGWNKVEELPSKEGEEVQKVIDLYDKKREAENNADSTKKDIFSTKKSKYDDEVEGLEKQNTAIENQNSLINKEIDYLNTVGRVVSGTAYETLIANLDKQKSIVEQELEVRKRELADLMQEDSDYENNPWYYDLQTTIQTLDTSLIDLTNQQAEYNDILRQLPVNNMQKLVDMYNNISTAMENWKNEIESAGKSVGADYYQEQIKNGQATIRQLQEQRSAVADVMDEYETGSDKWAEMNSKLTDIDSSISSIIVNMNEWNEAMLQIPIDKMEKLVSDLQMVKDALDDVNSEHQTVISAVTGAIDDQRKAWEEAQKAETDATQNKIDAIQDQLDLLDKQNEALDLQVAKEQALKKLEDAKTQKKTRVIRDGQIVYEADQDAIRDATDSLQDAETNLKKHELQTEKEKLEDELDVINDKYDKLYDKLDKIANKWEKIQPDREQLGNEKVADRYLGDDWINKVLSGNDDDIYSAFKELYDQNVDSQEQYEDQIKSTEQIQTLVNTYIEAYRSGTLTRDQAMTGIRGVLASVNHEITAGDNVNNILNYLSTQNSTGATTNDILTATQNQLSSTSKDIMQSLDVYEKNSNTITGYMSSFGELTTDVATMRSTINDVDDNLDNINSTLKDGFDDVVEALDSWRSRQEDDDDDDEKNGVHSTSHAGSNGWQSSDKFDGGNGKQGYEVGWTRKYANGIEEGIIGNVGDKEKYMAIREMATTDLKPSEQPILAHTGEIVLNPEQQAQLLKNIQQSTMTFKPETLNLKPVNVPTIERNTVQNINLSFGDLELKDIHDARTLANDIAQNFPSVMRQAMSKIIQ
mgnify:CR=1 FL=1